MKDFLKDRLLIEFNGHWNLSEIVAVAILLVLVVIAVLGIVKEYIGINDTTDGAILIADDSDVVRNFATKILNDKCKVFTAVNGLEAIKLINTNSNIKGLLLDLNMPEYDGFSVLDYLNRNGLFSRIKVSIITGDDEKDKITKAFAYPIMDVISKPFNVDTVNNTIDKMLS